MKKKLLLSVHAFLFFCFQSFSQSVGIGTNSPDTSAVLDISHISKGLLIPRLSTTAIDNILFPAKGLLVFDSTENVFKVNVGFRSIPEWKPITSLFGRNIFIGTGAGRFNTDGFSNVGIGTDALRLNIEISNTVAIGDSALFHNGSGTIFPADAERNTAVGSKSLFENTSGNNNTAIGFNSLLSNTDGSFNVAAGSQALFSNTTGRFNTALGNQALRNSTTANQNTAVGYHTMLRNTTGFSNTATGTLSLESNTTGTNNTAIGFAALNENITANNNTAIGSGALIFNTVGQGNSAIGSFAMIGNTGGSLNTTMGVNTLSQTPVSSNNTVIGANAGIAVNLGSGNTLVGAQSDASLDGITNSVAIGAGSRVTVSNQVRLGNANITSIGGQVGFSNLSDGRYKTNISESPIGIDFIMKLRAVTYQWKIGDQHLYTGFIAQEVEKAALELGYEFSGIDKPKNDSDPYSLRYADFVVPLVKAMQEQQKMIEQLQKELAELKKANAR